MNRPVDPTEQTERGAVIRHARRAAGQVNALGEMIADGRSFAEVAQQLRAARGSLDSLLVRLVELELEDCVPTGQTREAVDELLRTALGSTIVPRRSARTRRGDGDAAP